MEDVYEYISERVDDALESWQARRARSARRPAKRLKKGHAA
jgi:hypothetical protein